MYPEKKKNSNKNRSRGEDSPRSFGLLLVLSGSSPLSFLGHRFSASVSVFSSPHLSHFSLCFCMSLSISFVSLFCAFFSLWFVWSQTNITPSLAFLTHLYHNILFLGWISNFFSPFLMIKSVGGKVFSFPLNYYQIYKDYYNRNRNTCHLLFFPMSII